MKKAMKSKILIAVLAVLGISAIGMTLLSFVSAADGDPASTDNASATTVSFDSGKTNIDYIIENSNGIQIGDTADSVYHIVEIGSSNTASDYKKLIENGVFKDYVLDGHKSASEEMSFNPDEDKVDYKYFAYNADSASIVEAINGADLIYLSNDPDSPYTKGRDISEDVKIALSAAATGTYKPLIIDSHTKTQQIAQQSGNTYKDFVTQSLKPEGASYRTYSYDSSDAASVALSPNNISSLYVFVNGGSQKENGTWQAIETNAGDTRYVARVLTIKATASDNAITQKIQAGLNMTTEYTYTPVDTATGTDASPTTPTPAPADVTLANTYAFDAAADIHYVYHPYDGYPDAIAFDTLDFAEHDPSTEEGLAYTNSLPWASYDLIIIEGGISGSTADDAMKSILTSSMYANTHILYDSSLLDTSAGNEIRENTAANYKYVLSKVATENDVPLLDNVWVTSRAKISALKGAKRAKAVDDHANILIYGSFRGIGGGGNNGGSTSMYTVLEIQPDYPIDMKLAPQLKQLRDKVDPLSEAATNTFGGQSSRGSYRGDQDGFYYIRTASVSTQTADEITYDGKMSLTMMEDLDDYSSISDTSVNNNYSNVYDYYAWDLTKAKVAHATGLKMNQVKVVHMSSTEFNASKGTLLDNYDFIYIGGNNTSIKTDDYWHSNKALHLNYYTMYFHDGDTYTKPTNVADGFGSADYGVMLGNDITRDKLTALKEYATAGMPVVIDLALTSAYRQVADVDQRKLDPTSNMVELLDSYTTLDNVLWGFNPNDTIKIDNAAGEYGTTVNGFVTVFAGTTKEKYTYDGEEIDPLEHPYVNEDSLIELLKDSATRPRLTITSRPTVYIEGDESSWIKFSGSRIVTFKYEASEGASVSLYIDDNANSRFEPGEKFANGSNNTISWPVKDEFYGPVYWKVEATVTKESNGKPVTVSSSETGIFKIARTNQAKREVNLLQIEPAIPRADNSEATLYLCKECQQSRAILTGNRYTKTGKYAMQSINATSDGFLNQEPTNVGGTSGTLLDSVSDVTNLISNDANRPGNWWGYTYTGTKLGIHEHKFGIVKYYENLTDQNNTGSGLDDWNTNWFDDVKDDYIVTMDIMTVDEVDELVSTVNQEYKDVIDNVVFPEDSVIVDRLTDAGAIDSTTTAERRNKLIAEYKLQMLSDAVDAVRTEYYTNYTDYNRYYRTMKTIIDGKMASLSEAELNDLVNFMCMCRYARFDADSTFTAEEKATVMAELTSYNKICGDIDTYLNANMLSVTFDSTSTSNRAYELAFQTNSSVPGSERAYYDIYSLANAPNDTFYTGFTKLYVVWRNAKIWEQYFYDTAKQNQLRASVNYLVNGNDKEIDSQRNDEDYFGKINFADTYNCIAIGAAENFGHQDLSVDSCYALRDYADEGRNMLLFHDTLTFETDSTHNMSEILADSFGQNARHYTTGTSTVISGYADQPLTISYDGTNAYYTVKSSVGSDNVIANFEDNSTLKNNFVTFKYTDRGGNTATKKYKLAGTVAEDSVKVSVEQKLKLKDSAKVSFTVGGNTYPASGKEYSLSSVPSSYTYTLEYGEIPYGSGGESAEIQFYMDDQWGNRKTGPKMAITTKTSAINCMMITSYGGYKEELSSISTAEDGTDGKHAITFNVETHDVDWTNTITDANKTNNNVYYEIIIDGQSQGVKKLNNRNESINNYAARFKATPKQEVGADINGFGDQQFKVQVVNVDTGAVDNSQSVSLTVDGNTVTGNGTASLTRVNNQVVAEMTIAQVGTPTATTSKTDNQILNVTAVKIVGGVESPLTSGDGTLLGDTTTINVGDAGVAVLSGYKNYSGSVKGSARQTGTPVPATDYIDNQEVTITLQKNGTILANTSFTVKTKEGTRTLITDENGQAKLTGLKNYQTASTTASFTLKSGFDAATYFYKKNNISLNSTPVGFTDRTTLINGTINGVDFANDFGAGMHKYVTYSHIAEGRTGNNQMTISANDVRGDIKGDGAHAVTDKAKQNNEGIVTLYPYNLGSNLQVAPTNPQGYALDIEDPDMIVYYSLAGGTSGTCSSLLAADPMNGQQNYFLYQYKSVSYTGAGNAVVTGRGRNNNDERRLFINVILNAARPSVRGAELYLYDVDSYLDEKDGNSLKNRTVKFDPLGIDDYVRYVEGVDELPDFTFMATVDKGATISKVLIYWDLDYDPAVGTNSFSSDAGDVVIYNTDDFQGLSTLSEQNIKSGSLKRITVDYTDDNITTPYTTPYLQKGSSGGVIRYNLWPEEGYFKDNKAYIVVEVYDSKNGDKPVRKRVRIELKPERMHLN